jgi:geranylgeranyl reductase family protein
MTSRESCDVLIVGGGPAGSSCARQLRRAGLDVLILDKSQFPRDKVCAGWITPQVVEELEIDTHDYQQGRVLQPITSFIAGMGERTAKPVHYQKIVSYGIRRCEFDNYLLQRSGARMRLGEAWESMEKIDGRWLVNGEISAALVIGAGGHFCPVVRFLGANLGKSERAISAQEIEFEMTDEQALHCGVEHDRPELYFCDDLKGYGWCFRKGNFLNVGLGREGNKGLAEQVHTFSQWLQSQGKVPADAPARFKGHAYLLYSHATRPVVGDGVLIIGDAAGLAYAESGEGIRPAIESGLMAAQIIADARRDYSKQKLAEYETQLSARFGARNNGGSLASSLPESWKLAIARSLMQTQWFTRNVVLNRWFLHADTEPLRA